MRLAGLSISAPITGPNGHVFTPSSVAQTVSRLMMSSQHRLPARCPSEFTCDDNRQNHYGDESGQQWNHPHCASFTPSHAVDEASKDLSACEIRSSCFCFVPRVPAHIQHALPDMIFWLTSASGLNHVLTTLQTSCDLSIGDTASAMSEPRITAECIDRYKAGLSYCVPAPSLRSVIDRSLTAKMKLVFTFFRTPSYLWLHLFR